MLTHMIYESKSLYAQDISALQARIDDLEKKNEELEVLSYTDYIQVCLYPFVMITILANIGRVITFQYRRR